MVSVRTSIEEGTTEWIKDAEEGKYKINTSGYAKGCNDVLDYYIRKLKYAANEQGA